MAGLFFDGLKRLDVNYLYRINLFKCIMNVKKSPTTATKTPAKAAEKAPSKANNPNTVTATPAKPAAVKKTTVSKPAAPVKTSKPAAPKANITKAKAPAPSPATTPPVPTATPAADAKPKKVKLVRDSFTLPDTEYEVLSTQKKACLKDGIDIKKTELLRVALAALAKLSASDIAAAKAQLTPVPTGRPKK